MWLGRLGAGSLSFRVIDLMAAPAETVPAVEPVAAEPVVEAAAPVKGYKPLRKDEPGFYKNAPYSSRFPQQNQTNRCWAAYVQHKIAVKKFSAESREALKQKALYTTMCPHTWVPRPFLCERCCRPFSASCPLFG